MNKHTPGPWNLSDDWDGTSVKAGRFYVTHAVQSCGFHPEEEDKAITQANARLITAAPDLLEAVQSFLNWSDSVYYGEDTSRELASAKDKARAAIAAARASDETSK